MDRERLRRLALDTGQQVADFLLRASRLKGLATRNTLEYRVVRREAPFASLPQSFDGFRLLHLSDPHIDGIVDGGQRLFELLETLECDLCVMTGDYRFACSGDFEPVIELMQKMVRCIRSRHGVVGILGDHDALEMGPRLEEVGVRMLVNEATSVSRQGEAIWVAGADGTCPSACDVQKALGDVPGEEYTILLAHSPDYALEAASRGVDFCLAGHTHGGQLCLPFGIPIVTNARSPRRLARGAWTVGSMQGFTTRGVGASGLQARLFCPPEVVLHELRVAEPSRQAKRRIEVPRRALAAARDSH